MADLRKKETPLINTSKTDIVWEIVCKTNPSKSICPNIIFREKMQQVEEFYCAHLPVYNNLIDPLKAKSYKIKILRNKF